MSTFSRPADWLRQLFIPSRFGWTPPSAIASEVSLVQPYDGGGFPLWPTGQWILNETAAAASSGVVTFLTIPEDQIARILAVSVTITAGVLPSCALQIGNPSVADLNASPTIVPSILNEGFALEPFSPIIPPDHRFRVRWYGGDGLTVVNARALICRVPLGSVFYV